MSNEIILKTEKLNKIYLRGEEKVWALKDIDLEIRKGEFLSILGPSGSGKTTLLNLLSGFDKPTSGKVIFLDRDISLMKERELQKIRSKYVGFIFQDFLLFPNLTVYENILLPFYFNKGKIKKEKILEIIEKLSLTNRLKHHPYQLSGGEMQRVAIARALAIEPLIIFADEPTGNLDSENAFNIFKIFENLSKEGYTIIVVTHNWELISKFNVRKIHLRDGRII
ncbi:MAG: ABC transporter ATP-binding protein [candidate division WOR-3 bacterium]|nr:ABC transporter ATP-binding protein [candidate division WOR-3 bacterium]MDW8114176.1 ABC transporter ATP-binding protein [candidate division WOR-3 bacterium]